VSRRVALFDLAGEITRRHERSQADRVTVIPVLVEDLETASPLLQALCDVNEGSFLSALEPSLQSPVPATLDRRRREIVGSRLTGEPDIRRRVVVVDRGAGRLDAEFVDPPAIVPSPGEQEVLAVARAVVHQKLDDEKFVVIAYRAQLVDFTFQRALWALAVDGLDQLPHPTLRTLVFVAQSPIDIGMHCQTGRGFRLAIDGGRFLRRKGTDDLRIAAQYIAKHPDPIVLFLGAGFSASSGLPLGPRLRDMAIGRLLAVEDIDLVKSVDLATRFHQWVSSDHPDWLTHSEQQMSQAEFVNQLTLEQVIRVERRMYPDLPSLQQFRELEDRNMGSPGVAVRDLVEILAARVGRLVLVTVNFDLLIERNTKTPLRVFASEEDFKSAPAYLRRYLAREETKVPLLKLHGTIATPETCVVSSDQTELGVGQIKLEALRVLLGADKRRLWIYVGAGMRDRDLRPLLLGEEFARGVDERWVSPFLDTGVEEFAKAREPAWRKETDFTGIYDRLITETADAFLAELGRASRETP
jgi:hypothetical protein